LRLERIGQSATPAALPENAETRLAAIARQQLTTFTHPEYIALFRIFTSEAPRSPGLRRMIESNWVGLLFYKIIDQVSPNAISAHAALVTRIFLDGLAPTARQSRRVALETAELRPRRRAR
jgi:AefR-like transcriptional repressor, C-terminal domain